MRTLRLFIVLALAGALPGCSALFDGSRFLGGDGDGDGGVADGGGDPDDGGSDGGTDAGVDPCLDVTCEADEYCDEGDCTACDDDDDGFVVERTECTAPAGLFDCDDANPDVYPGALPSCGNGTDESCGLMAPIGLPADEIGFFPVRALTPPPAESGAPPDFADLQQVRVAALSADRAGVFFQTRAGRAMIWYSNVALGDPGAPDLVPYYELDAIPTASAIRLSFDVGRDATDRVHLVAMIEDFTARATLGGTPPWIRTHDIAFDSAGAVIPGGGGGASYRPESSGYGAFNVIGQPAVVRGPAGGFLLAVPSNFVTVSGSPSNTLVAFGTSGVVLDHLGGTYPPLAGPWPEWAVSNGRAAVLPGTSGSYIVWDGRLDPGNPNETRQFMPPEPHTGRPVILSSNEAGNRVHRVLLPRADEIVVYRVSCPEASPLGSCAFDVTAPLRIPIALGAMDPLMTSFTGDEMGFHFAYVARDGTMPRVRYVQYRYSDGMLADLPLPTPGNARIADLDIDGTFVDDPEEGGAAGRALLTFAYARRNAANEPTLFVGGVSACIGYGTD